MVLSNVNVYSVHHILFIVFWDVVGIPQVSVIISATNSIHQKAAGQVQEDEVHSSWAVKKKKLVV